MQHVFRLLKPSGLALLCLGAEDLGNDTVARFSLGGNFGPNVFAPGYPQSQAIACSASSQTVEADVDEVETPGSRTARFAVGGTGGTGWVIPYYDSDRHTWQYLYLWKTDRTWAGTCRQLIIQFNDGSAPHVANFKFVR